MVDRAGRRRVSSDSVDFVSAGHVRTSRMAVVVVVWPGHNLVVRPNCVVLGLSYYEDMHLALSIGDSLVDAMGKAVKKIEQTVDGGHEPYIRFLSAPERTRTSGLLIRSQTLCI